jgi:2-hydroxycyclohexanecarboxyl-CoA dehydrogenase
MMETPEELANAAAGGDRNAFASLVRITQPFLWRYLSGVLRDSELAEEAAQETWARVVRSIRLYRGDAAFTTWLIAVARRTMADILRGRERTGVPAGDDIEKLAERAPRGGTQDLPYRLIEVSVALRELPAELREAIVLTRVVGLSYSETDAEFWERILRINLLSVLGMCRAVVPAMIDVGYGRIVNIASDAARVGSSGEAPYSGAKAGIIGFSKALAREVARHGITVNVVCPGPSATPLLEEMTEKSDDAAKVLRAISRSIPLGRLAEPEDIAFAVAFFASENAGYITGQVLSVSGGLTMAG